MNDRQADRRSVLLDPALDAQLARDGFVVVPLPRAADVAAGLSARYGDLHGWTGEGFEPDLTNPDTAYRMAASATIAAELDEPVTALFADHRPFLRNFLCKWPGPGSELYLHRDWMYVDEGDGDHTFVVWTPLRDVEETDGPLQVLRGSHRYDGSLRGTDLNAPWIQDLDVLRPRLETVTVRLGEAAILDNALVHSSLPNAGIAPRLVAAVGVRPSSTPLVHFRSTDDGRAVRYDVDESFFLTTTPGGLLDEPPALKVQEHRPGIQRTPSSSELASQLDRVASGEAPHADGPGTVRRSSPAPSVGPVGGQPRPRLLIVNADDFGLSPGVCRGILRAHEHGVVTSTSALVLAPHFAANAAALRDSGLPTGAHLSIAGEELPLLSAREIPSLVDHAGRFPRTWQGFVRRAAQGRIDPDDLRRELGAQLELFGQVGLTPTHLDTHQNLHLWPQVASVLVDLARANDIGALRSPQTARWGGPGAGVRVLSALLRRRISRSGLRRADTSVGLDEVGTLGTGAFLAAIARLEHAQLGSAEIITHLGEDPDPLRPPSVGHFGWADELAAVCSVQVRTAIDRAGFVLGSYADLPDGPSPTEPARRRSSVDVGA